MDLDELLVAAMPDDPAESIAAMKILFAMLDCNGQLFVRLDRFRHMEISVKVFIERRPGAEDQLLVVFDADFVA